MQTEARKEAVEAANTFGVLDVLEERGVKAEGRKEGEKERMGMN